MMENQKTLVIVRHGKSSWDFQGVSDIDRPLKERGVKNAYEIAERLKNHGVMPEMILSSPACRAIHTAIIFMRMLNIPEDKLRIKSDIYLAGTEDILRVIALTDDEINTLMIFGHNPGFTDLVNNLSDLNIPNVPTAGVVILNFRVKDWGSLERSVYISGKHEFPGE